MPVALAGLFIGSSAIAQETTTSTTPFRTWSVGVNAGVLTGISPLGGQNDFSTWKNTFGYGLYIKKQITPSFSLRLDGTRGTIKGDNSEGFNDGKANASPYSSYSTDLNYSANLSAVANLFNWSMFKQQNNAQMYVSAGGGFVNYTATRTTTGNVSTELATKNRFNIPVGLGAKFRLADAINLDLGWTINFVDNDEFDGYARGTNDKFNYAYAGLEFALGKGQQLAFFSPTAATYDEAVAAKNAANALKSDLDAQKAENARLRSDMNDLLKDR